VSLWRADMQKAAVGQETIRKAMVLLQAMFTFAVEWGESSTNPVSLVRKPRQGRQRAIEVLDPRVVELVRGWMLARGTSSTRRNPGWRSWSSARSRSPTPTRC
jgi:site-specific recombinase XerD